jgi:quinoprotein glucose dehydrogenase
MLHAVFGSVLAILIAAQSASAQDHKTWRDYGGASDAAQYSALTQINRSNVAKLEVAWIYPTGDNNRYFFNPLVVDGVIFVLAKSNSIVALDAATGKEIWTHTEPDTTVITNRGINFWESKDGSDRRLLFSSNHFLRAIDARTGQSILSFGTNGRVDLKAGLDRDPGVIRLVQSTTPGRVFEDLLILGSATNQGYGSAPGDIRAFDVRTGKLAWTFHTIPRPGEFGYDTWPKDAWKRVGGANVWGEFSVDEKRGIVYAPTASAKYNFYGADRNGSNLFADCLLALDARTGKRLWHFQMVHHDIWDYDDATAPKLLTVRHEGKLVDVVAQVSKQGFLWVFDRVTGKPLWPIEERPVPRSDMPGEETWPTQPFPLKPPPFARLKFTVDDLSPYLSPQDRARFRDEILSARNEGLFTPPGQRNTVQMPGNNGGANWGGAAVDPNNGGLFVVSKDLPAMLKLAKDPEADKALAASAGERFYTGFGFMIASDGLSPIAPPWSSLTAYDLNEGTIRWKIPLGDVPALAAKGIKGTGSHYPKVGPVVTAGGLIFTGTRDRMVRALDVENGKPLWEHQVDSALEGMPAIYEVGGRQYIVFCASAQVGLTPATQVKIHGAYVAFALPPAAVRIILVGDSTIAVKSGWGPGFCADVASEVTCVNMAKGGRSSSSYRAEGSWDKVMDELKRNSEFQSTYVLIQFGHNDQPGKPGRSTDLATEFPANLRRYVEEVKSTGAMPVLITPLTRRAFRSGKLENSLEPWADATRKIGVEQGIPVLELNADSVAAVEKMGPAEANTLAMGPPPTAVAQSASSGDSVAVPKATGADFDYTHLGAKGSAFFARMVAGELVQAVPDLRPYFKP